MNAITRIQVAAAAEDDGARLVRLAKSLASPVARGLLPHGIADSELLLAAVEARRGGEITVDPIDLAAILKHILGLYVRELVDRRAIAKSGIRETITGMFAVSAPLNRLLAEAHDANGDAGFPLREWEVTEFVGIELAAAMRESESVDA